MLARGGNFILFFLVLVALAGIVSAEIVVSPPEALYNKGDDFNASAVILAHEETSGFVVFNLGCDGESVELYRSPLHVDAGKERTISVSTVLDRFITGNASGSCSLLVSYGKEESRSRTFIISKEISVSAQLPQALYDPGQTVNVQGTAFKRNGKPLKGIAELSFSEGISRIGQVEEGKFNMTFELPNDIPSGEHSLKVKAYEKDSSGEVLNEGFTNVSVRINQIVKETQIAFNKADLVPGEELIFSVLVYDQAGLEMPATAKIKIAKPSGEAFAERVISASTPQNFITEMNASPGTWVISSSVNELTTSKSFSIASVENVTFTLVNATLIVANEGNVPINKPIEIKIGNISEIKQISLGIGESRKFRLGAPDGQYEIEVGDGTSNEKVGRAFLTGKAVDVKDLESNGIVTSSLSWLWVVLLVALGSIAFYYYRKIARKSSISIPTQFKTSSTAGSSSQAIGIEEGKKQKGVIISLKLKGMSDIDESPAKETLHKIIESARKEGARIMKGSDHFNFIFAPIVTKEDENALRAVKTAVQVRMLLNTHNRKYASKIPYGIGVNEGDLIVELKQDSFKYHPLGNTVSLAKKMAEEADNDIYISHQVHSATRAKVKVDRVQPYGKYWRVSGVSDNGRHSEFISKFMERQGRK